MLTADVDTGFLATRYNDIVDETRKRRCAAYEESGDRAPVGGEFRRVAVDAMEVVHVRYRNVGFPDDEIAAARHISGCNRGRPDFV